MSGASAIRAGAAYVEVYLEQNRITRDLASVQAKLRGWSASLSRMGSSAYGGALPGPLGAIANFAASPAGMFAGLLAAANTAATSGAAIADLAEKAGTSVEAISALAYAARRSHVDVEQLATGIKRMQVNIVDAARGGKEAQEVFATIGLNANELGRLLPEQQLGRIADRIAAIQNPAERAAIAVKIFGRSGTDLLPLLIQGADGIAKWEDRAKRLGLVASGKAAEGARKFSQLLGDLNDVMQSGVKVIGGAMVPYLSDVVDKVVNASKAIRDWVKDHRGLVVVALQVTGAIVAGGLAFSVLGRVLGIMAGSVGLLLAPFRILGGLVGGIGSLVAGAFSAVTAAGSVLAPALAFLITPMGLLMSAAVGLAAYFLWSSGTIGAAVNWLKQVFADLAADSSKTFQGIKDALVAGDIALAAKVLWAMLRLEWQKGVAFLETIWEGFKGTWNDAVMGIALAFTNAVAKVKTIWADMIGWMEKTWNAFKLSGFTETLASWFAPIFAKLQGVSVADAQKALSEDFAAGRNQQPKADAEIDAATRARKGEIETDRQGTEDSLAADKLARDKKSQARIAAAQAEADAARKELDNVAGAARDARARALAPTTGYAKSAGIGDILGIAANAKSSAVGTFSGYALGGLAGTGDVQKKMENHLAAMRADQRELIASSNKIHQAIKNSGLVLE